MSGACGHFIPHPVRLILEQGPDLSSRMVSDALVRLRCSGCGKRNITVHLCEGANRPNESRCPASAVPLLRSGRSASGQSAGAET